MAVWHNFQLRAMPTSSPRERSEKEGARDVIFSHGFILFIYLFSFILVYVLCFFNSLWWHWTGKINHFYFHAVPGFCVCVRGFCLFIPFRFFGWVCFTCFFLSAAIFHLFVHLKAVLKSIIVINQIIIPCAVWKTSLFFSVINILVSSWVDIVAKIHTWDSWATQLFIYEVCWLTHKSI